MTYKKILEGSEYPVVFSDVTNHIKLTDSADNSLVSGMIVTAWEYVEQKTRQVLMPAKFELFLDEWPEDEVWIEKSPVTGIDKVELTSIFCTKVVFTADDVIPVPII